MASTEQVAQFVKLTEPYYGRLLRIAVAMCKERDLAADLTQETLLKAFLALDNFRPGAPVLPWLTRILRNVFIDTLRTGRARHEVAEHQLKTESANPVGLARSGTMTPLAQVEQSQLSTWLQEELSALPCSQQLLIVLCDVEGFTYQEAAEAAGVPVGTVRSRLSRGRESLRLRLKRRMGEDDG